MTTGRINQVALLSRRAAPPGSGSTGVTKQTEKWGELRRRQRADKKRGSMRTRRAAHAARRAPASPPVSSSGPPARLHAGQPPSKGEKIRGTNTPHTPHAAATRPRAPCRPLPPPLSSLSSLAFFRDWPSRSTGSSRSKAARCGVMPQPRIAPFASSSC